MDSAPRRPKRTLPFIFGGIGTAYETAGVMGRLFLIPLFFPLLCGVVLICAAILAPFFVAGWWLLNVVLAIILVFFRDDSKGPEWLHQNTFMPFGMTLYFYACLAVVAVFALGLVFYILIAIKDTIADAAWLARETKRAARRAKDELLGQEQRAAESQARAKKHQEAMQAEEIERARQLREESERQAKRHEERTKREEEAARRRRAEDEAFQMVSRVTQCGRDAQHVYPAYTEKRCPFCRSEENQVEKPASEERYRQVAANLFAGVSPVAAHAPRPSSDSSIPQTEEALAQRMKNLQDSDDYPGIGNLILDVLMIPGREDNPDPLCQLLDRHAGMLILGKYSIGSEVSYSRPHRDEHLPWHIRGEWARDRFPQLIIDAYVLGAVRSNLAPPHNRLVAYYRAMAVAQDKSILESIRTWKTRRHTVDEVDAILNSEDPDLSPEAKLRAAKERFGFAEKKRPPTRPPPAPEV